MTTNGDDPEHEKQEKSGQGLTSFAERIKNIDAWELVKDPINTAVNMAAQKGVDVDLSPLIDAAEYLSHTVRYGQPAIQAGIEKEINDIRENIPKSSEELDQMAKESDFDPMMDELHQAKEKDRQASQNLKEQQEDERAALLNAQEVQKQEMLESLQKRGVDDSRIQELLTQQQKVFEDQLSQQQNEFKEQQKQIEQKHEKDLFHPER
jgi:DNA repair exonuclease SbcCD ATPase subunit